MATQVQPFAFRLGITKDWKSRWFHKNEYKNFLREDFLIRDFLTEKLRKSGLDKVELERSASQLKVIIFTSKPGLIIGRGGTGAETLKKEIEYKYRRISKTKKGINIKLQIEEITKPEINAQLVAQQIADQIEKRMQFRRTMKQAIEKVMQNKEAQGVKVRMSGRLDGSEMSRTEWLLQGKIPLQTLRADVDFATVNAYCTYGVVGIKVWIYKGEIFDSKAAK